MPRALLSVTDKTGLVEFARGLSELGFELVSTGGTAKAIREAGLAVVEVAEITGFPEMLDGRVKTLHPGVHGGLLGDRRLESHRDQMAEAGITGIDVAVINLYAFEKTVGSDHTHDQAIESIDIGGPAMVRASAKNWANVAIVTDPADYASVLEALKAGTIADHRLALSAKAFRHTAFYDSMISRYLSHAAGEEPWTETLTTGLRRTLSLRYGENPHQSGALYVDPLATDGIARATQLWGKELSYNNLLDSDGAWELVSDMPAGSVAIIKHGNPCGAAAGDDLADSYRLAREADPISAFGGIAACHGRLDLKGAEAMTEKGNFLEVVIADGFDDDAVELFKNRAGWGQSVRLLDARISGSDKWTTIRTIRGGALVQESDEEPLSEWKVATNLVPTENQWAALNLAWRMIPHVKSNAILVADHRRLLGAGAGQMNRVQSVRLALEQAGEASKGAVLASDAFFPFPDSIETAAAAGIAAIIQPGGSKKDDEVIEAANRLGIAMVLTGVRHFRH